MDYPMSGDEVWVSVISTGLAAYTWGSWYWSTLSLWPAHWRPAGRGLLWAAPFLATILIALVLRTVASFDVVNDPRYLYMYYALGMAWVGIATRSFALAGLLVRDDVVERRNPAVAPALTGAILGMAACYAGGNIGDGPGWWVVVFSAFFSSAGLLVTWLILDGLTGIGDAVTIERDPAAGWRLGSFLAGAGLILGRAVAGDWVSGSATLRDAAVVGWPVLGLVALAVAFERTLRGTEADPQPPVVSSGVMPGLALLGLATAYVTWLGIPQ